MIRAWKLSLLALSLSTALACQPEKHHAREHDAGASPDAGDAAESDAGSADAGTPDLPGVSADIDHYLQGLCAKSVECGTEPGPVEECVTIYRSYLCGMNYGAVTLPGLDACLASLSCENIDSSQPSAECAQVEAAVNAADGQKLGQAGDGCNQNYAHGSQVCAPGLYCTASDEQCGTCLALKSNGKACELGEECESDSCSPDGVCQPKLADGAKCTFSDECKSGGCIHEQCAKPATLLGQACQSHDACAEAGLRCSANKCAPKLTAGEACQADDECTLACLDHKCAAPAACGAGERGTPCVTSAQCTSGLVCDVGNFRCQPPIADGQPCAVFSPACADHSFCAPRPNDTSDDPKGVCKPFRKVGETCNEGEQCESGVCNTTCVAVDLCRGKAK